MRVTGPQGQLIRLALRFRGVAIALSCLLLAFGVYSLEEGQYDVFPEFAPPQVSVQTEAPGLAPEQVEMLVTRPVETALAGVSGLARMVSQSIQGLSIVTVFFQPSSSIYLDRQLAAERLAALAGRLPTGVQPPLMTPLTSSTEIALVVGLTSSRRSLMQLRTLAEWTIEPTLLAVPGVANVEVFGGEQRSLQILVHPQRLVRFGLGMDDVIAAARRATGVRGAGFLSTPNQRIVIQTRGQLLDPAGIGRVVLATHQGASVTLSDVADVLLAPEPAVGAGEVNGVPAVVLNVIEQYGTNTLRVTRDIDAALATLRPALAQDGVTLHAKLFRPANFIQATVSNLRDSLAVGAVLVIATLLLFLYDLRTAAICCIAIPLSLLAAVIVLQYLGQSLNTMTLGGLAVALGEVVDDAVIGVENISRRVRENRRSPTPRAPIRVVLEATFEVRSAVVYATFAVILIFLPVVTLSGLAGRLFAPLGITYILAVLASLGVAVTVTPALSLLLLPSHTRLGEPPVSEALRRRYESLLWRILRAPRAALIAAAVLTVASLAFVPFFEATFLPELHEGHFVLHVTAVPGTSLQESLRIGARISAALEQLPFVRSVAQRAGRANLTADTHGTHQSELEVELRPGVTADAAKARMLKALADFPGVTISANTFLTERIDETLSGYTAPVAVDIYGNDLATLSALGRDVARVLSGISGAASVEVQSPLGLPQVSVILRPDALRSWGLEPVQVLDAIGAAYRGEVVGQTYEGNRLFDVLVELALDRRGRIDQVGDLPMRAPGGTYVPLRELADIRVGSGLYSILHEGGRRLQVVTFDVQGRNLADFVREARRRIAARIRLPSGTYLQFAGVTGEQTRAAYDLLLKAAFAAAGIVLLLSVVTRNWRNLLLILANLPFALSGGIFIVAAAGGELSLGSLVGFVTVLGITLRNSMMVISHYEHLVAVDRVVWAPEVAVRGAADRLPPILMTSLVTGLGLLPLAISMDSPGREIEGAMALVILGGLITSAALNLLVLPILALRFGRFEAAAADLAVLDATDG
jgi:CzcA family heavy metal efflux pump